MWVIELLNFLLIFIPIFIFPITKIITNLIFGIQYSTVFLFSQQMYDCHTFNNRGYLEEIKRENIYFGLISHPRYP